MYKEYIRTIETEVGTLELIYVSDGEPQVWLNQKRIMVPSAWLKQTSTTIVKKVCQLVKSAKSQGVTIGGIV